MALLDSGPALRHGPVRHCALLEFRGGHASFFCSTQSSRCQMVQIVEHVPAACAPKCPSGIRPICRGASLIGSNAGPSSTGDRRRPAGPLRSRCNRYGLQSGALREPGARTPAPSERGPIETAVANMPVLDAVRRSAESGRWGVGTGRRSQPENLGPIRPPSAMPSEGGPRAAEPFRLNAGCRPPSRCRVLRIRRPARRELVKSSHVPRRCPGPSPSAATPGAGCR